MKMRVDKLKTLPVLGDQDCYRRLLASIKEEGVKSPIVVVHRNGKWQVVDGNLRVLAAREAGLTHIEAHVIEEHGLVEARLRGNSKLPTDWHSTLRETHDYWAQHEAQEGPFHWVTRDGRKLRPRDIADGHLGNILRLLERNGHTGQHAFRVLAREAERRELEWRVDPDTFCEFDVDGQPCDAPMAMWTPEGEPRCEFHRSEKRRSCSGCGSTKKVAFQQGELFFCEDCCTPQGAFAAFLAWLILIVTIGRVRL